MKKPSLCLRLLGRCMYLKTTDQVSLFFWYLKTVNSDFTPLGWKNHGEHTPIINAIVSYCRTRENRLVTDAFKDMELWFDNSFTPLQVT